MKKHNCQVMCSALNGVNSWSPALFYKSAPRKAVFSEKAHVKSIWSADDTSQNRQVKCWCALAGNINQICVTCLKSGFSECRVRSTTTTTESRFVMFNLKCSWSKGRREHTYILKQLSWGVICPLKKNEWQAYCKCQTDVLSGWW